MNAAPAEAQATRTWVSGTGDNINPCSRTSPCRTFAAALAATAINGEINCLDPADYGTVFIAKSITIDCEDTQGTIFAGGSTGVSINIMTTAAADPLATVRLRGLSINGSGGGAILGATGIHVPGGNTRQVKLFVDEVFVQNFSGRGIAFTAPGGHLVVRDSLITNTGLGGASFDAGILAVSTLAGATGIIHVSITRTTTHLNHQGIRFEGNTFGVVSKSTASNNAVNGFVVFPSSNGGAEMTIVDSTANNNGQFAVFAGGGGGRTGIARIRNLTAIHNPTNQLHIGAGGQILSNGRNGIGTPSHVPGVFADQ